MKRGLITAAIVGLLLAGAALLGSQLGISASGNLGATLFLGFLALVVAFQVAPAVMMIGVLLKEGLRASPKEKKEVGASAGDDH